MDITGFEIRLRNLSDSLLDAVVADVPAEWNNESLLAILGHLQSVRANAAEFAEQVRSARMKVPYSFSVLRYVHDPVTQEFVNIGVAVYSPQARFLRAICTSSYARLSDMFQQIDGQRFRQFSRYIQDQICSVGQKFETASPWTRTSPLNRRWREFCLFDDSALQFSKPGVGLSADLNRTLQDLYQRHVEQYGADP